MHSIYIGIICLVQLLSSFRKRDLNVRNYYIFYSLIDKATL